MRTKVTLILVFLNVALFFFIFGFERKWRTEQDALEARQRVLGPEAANIQTLTIRSAGLDAPIRLTRDGDAWNITSPFEWPANPYAVSRIVSELQFLEHKTSFPVDNLEASGMTLADYGLAEPALTVSFSSGSGAPDETVDPITLGIGKKTDIGSRLYVLSPAGDRVHVVSQSLAEALALDLDELRAPSCFTIPGFEVRSLNLQNAGPANVRVRLRRDGNRWAFESPIVTRASRTETETTLGRLNSLQIHEFLGSARSSPDRVAASGTDTPSLRITLEGNNRRETLLLGNSLGDTAIPAATATQPDREFYARMEGRDALFTIVMPEALINNLRNAQGALRDPHVLDLEGRRINTVTISGSGDDEVVLQQLEPVAGTPTGTALGWQVLQRDNDGSLRTQPADREVVENQLLRDLNELKAVSFLRDVPTDADLERWGLINPTRTVRLAFRPEPGATGGADQATLLLGTDETGRQAFAKLQRQTFVYQVDPAIFGSIPMDPLHFRQRLLRELPAGAKLVGLSLRDLTSGNLIYAHDLAANETWETVFERSPIEQRDALRALRAQLRTLRAQRFVRDGFPDTILVNGSERAWRYRLDAKLAVTGDAGVEQQDSTLFIAERDGGDLQLVGSPEFNVVFEAQPALIEALWNLTYAERDPGPIEFTEPPAETPAPTPDTTAMAPGN